MLRTYNDLDYASLLIWMAELPTTARTRGRQCNAAVLRRSLRIPVPSQKLRENSTILSAPDITLTPVATHSSPIAFVPSSSASNPTSLPNVTQLKSAPSPLPNSSLVDNVSQQNSSKTSSTQLHTSIKSTDVEIVPDGVVTQTSTPQMFHLNSLMTHFKFGCKNFQSLSHMSKSESLSHMPPIKCPSRDCPACLLVKGAKLRRNLVTSLTNLRPGQLLMMDFAFFNFPSIRSYKSYLSVTCQSTGYTFTYPTHCKRAPVDIIKWHILA